MKNQLKTKLQSGKKVVGTMQQIASVAIAECLGISGLDFFVADMEHAPFDAESLRSVIMAAELRGTTPLCRIKNVTKDYVQQALDIGAMGIVAPGIESPEEVRALVRYAKYIPGGNRGFCYTRTSAFGYADFAKTPNEYIKACNEQTLIIPQCETKQCAESIEEIVAIPGVDGIFVGPFDLSVSLGCPADFGNPVYKDAIKRALEACERTGKFAITFAVDVASAKASLDAGFSGVAIGTDIDTLIRGYRSTINEVTKGMQ
ncbi:MAG: aldolase/citrate lyase family protein [Oscillospiraceae bacterium]|nr:aldolase/citrate lyase family protein [Oscillospiraceae bacterium]